MKGKKIWGIELVLIHDAPINSVPAIERRSKYRVFTYEVRLAERVSGDPIHNPTRMFISSKELHARLDHGVAEKLRGMIGTELGSMQCVVDEPRHVITTVLVNPFSNAPGRTLQPPTDIFSKLGLATRVEQRMEEHLRKEYPGFKIKSTDHPSPERIAQLRKRERAIASPTQIEEAIHLSRAQNRRNFLKNRIRPPSTPRRK